MMMMVMMMMRLMLLTDDDDDDDDDDGKIEIIWPGPCTTHMELGTHAKREFGLSLGEGGQQIVVSKSTGSR
eukprot:6577423-Karenia_brevis.AAC.1